jgi:hypothetical protein
MNEVRKQIIDLESDEHKKRDELEKRLLELTKLDEFAIQRLNAYKSDHANLQQQPDTVILSLDFTSAQTSMSDDFNDCIVVIATATPLPIPDALNQHLVVAEKPPSFVPKPELRESDNNNNGPKKKARRTKLEMIEQKIQYPKPNANLRTDIANHKKRFELPVVCHFSIHLYCVRY